MEKVNVLVAQSCRRGEWRLGRYGTTPRLSSEGEIQSDTSQGTVPQKETSAVPKLVPPFSWDPVCPSPAIGLH